MISHQEVESQLQFLQAINEICFSGGLGSQGQHALCKQPEQTSNNDHMQTTGLPACHADTLQTGHRFHFLARVQSHKLTDVLNSDKFKCYFSIFTKRYRFCLRLNKGYRFNSS